ncbi:MAG: TonB-dependent receptor [Saprospiraceae bacterium]|nr:TonB-dependent receptor [Saprospiraceae bacterium]
MKKLLLAFAILSTQVLLAQMPQQQPAGGPQMQQNAKGIAKLTGTIVDSSNAKGVEFANIALYNQMTNKLVDGAVADEKGKFSISELADGVYKVQISFLGFNNKTIDNLKIEKGKNKDLGNIKLSSSEKLLNEVTVTSQRAMVEEKVDRLVYNAEKDVNSRGGDATEVLKKVPMLTVDLDGNVSLRGSSNIKVLINNKPSTIMASSVADALKQIPADMIKSVEVITSPSAKYDAEGSGGIINIITKKNNLEGKTLNVDLGVGNRGTNLGLNGSLRKGKFGMNLGGFGRYGYNKATTDLEQKTLVNGKEIVTKQTAEAFDNPLFGHYNLGMDYDIDKTQSLTGSVRYGLRNFQREQDQTTNLFQNGTQFSSTLRNINSRDASNSVDVNVDYLKTFKPQQEWSISSQYSRNDLLNNFDADLLNTSGSILSRQKNINNNLNQEVTFQTDYQTPLSKNGMIEFGAKGIFRQVNSDYTYQIAEGANGTFDTDASRPTGNLNYDQNVGGVYASYLLSTKNKYNIKIGSRYEYTSIDATQDGKAIDIPSYGNLVPSVNISKNVREGLTVKAAYNRRIQRPGLQQLNPNLNASNIQNITVGNPNLRPELTDNFELGLSTNIKKTYINASIFGRFTDNVITQIRQPSDSLAGAIVTTYQNIGKQQAYGTNIFMNLYILPNWTVNGGFDVMYMFLEGTTTGLNGLSQTVSNEGFVLSGRLMSSVNFKNGWGIQAWGGGRGAQVQLQGRQGGFGMYSVGLKKDFKNKKGSIGLAGENFFTPARVIRTELNSPLFSQVSVNNLYNRGVRLTLNYKFGSMTFNDRKKTRSVKNDDIKEGDGGGDNGGGQMQGGQQQGSGRPQGGQMPQGAKPQGGTPQQSAKPQGQAPQQGAKTPQQKPANAPKEKEKGN